MASSSSTGPSMFEVTLGAVLSILLGAFLAAGYLMAQPVETVRGLPRESDAEKVYYVTGSSRSSLGKGWLRKKQSLLESGPTLIELSEDELNTWLGSSAMQAESEDEEGGLLTLQRMNFRLADGCLQVGLPCEVNLPGWKFSTVVQTRGSFASDGDGFVYLPEEIMVGQLAAHRLPIIGRIVMNRLDAVHDVPDELEEAWKTLSEVNVANRRLVLVRR